MQMMRGNGRGGRGGGRGGAFGGFSQQPTNTVSIRVSEIQQPVTEDVMRRVFQSVGVSCNNIQITPTNNPQETSVVAQFPDNFAAERVMTSLNNRNIFNNGNKMAMQYTNWLPSGSPAPMGGNGGGVLQSPGGFDANAGGYAPQPMQVQQPMQVPQPPQVQPQGPGSVFSNPAANMMGMAPQMGDWNAAAYQQGADMFGQNGNFNGARGGMMRGGRARGRGGRGGFGFDPMNNMQAGYAPYVQRGMGRGGNMNMNMNNNNNNMMMRGGRAGYNNNNQYQQFAAQPTVFVSVTLVPATEPLQPIFTLMEAFGGVVAIRRNNNKKEILTVKAASPEDAQAIVTFMHRVPYAGGQVSGKLFPTYLERYPCTDAGDPLDPETTQYDFTASRHRSPGQRSKAVPSKIIKITGCNNYEDTEVMTFLNGKGITPERVTKSDDGSFEVQLADVATSVKVLLECQGGVCDEEKSNVIFVEGPRDEPAEPEHKEAEEQKNEQ